MCPTKILVVEDEQLVAADLARTLEALGYQVSGVAKTGPEALLQVEIAQPDLILMDIRLMGDMDGVETSEKIQARFQLPVVYLTANADRGTLERVQASRPFGYLLKPFDEAMLSTTIEIALSRHAAEREVQKALQLEQTGRQVAETQNQRKTNLLAMVSHELRNPLAIIQFAAEVLQNYGDQLPPEKKQTQIRRIRTATSTLTTLLEEVLVLERAEAGPLLLDREPIDLVGFCQEQIDTFEMNTDSGCTFHLAVQGKVRPVQLDDQLLWHLLNNLLSNAVKYSPQGGAIALTLTYSPNGVTLQVQDQGIGIPPECQDSLFEPFRRATNVGKIPGTGLGLAIAKQCVEHHQGTITVDSTVGKGSTFTIYLPQ